MQTSGSEDAKSVYHRHRRRQCRRENDLCAAASDGAGGHRRSAAFYGRLFQAGSRATVGGRKHGAALPGRQLPGGVRSAASAAGRGRGCGKRRLPRPDRRRPADALGPRAVRNAGFAAVRRLPRGRADSVRRLRRNMQWGCSFDEIADVYLDLVRTRHDEFVEPSRWRADLVVNGNGCTDGALAVLTAYIRTQL